MVASHTQREPALVLAVDVESDWGHDTVAGVREVLPRLLDLLRAHDAQATFFVVGELAEQVRAVLDPATGHEVGSHGLTHRPLDRLGREERRHELRESRRRLQALGYEVTGFRAPFLRTTPDLPELLVEAGYDYDASLGSLFHGFGGRAQASGELARLGGSALRGGLLPFNLTWLRLLHPLGVRAAPRRPRMFSLHLHELLDGDGGWHALPRPLRRLHALHSGATAWRILDRVLASYRGRITTCRSLSSPSPSSSAPAPRG